MKYWLSVGVQVTASASDVSSETLMVTASARKKTPVTPVITISGMKTTTGVMVEPMQRNRDFFQRAADGLQASLPGIAMQDNIFHDHNGIVDDQSHGCGQAAQRHQVESLPHHLERDERDHDGHGNHQAGDQRRSPVAQKYDQNDRGQNQTQQNGVAHALDRFAYDDRLIVEGLNLDSGRQRLAETLDFVVNFLRHLHGIAVGLPVDVQQDRRLSVRGDNRVDRLHARSDAGNISDASLGIPAGVFLMTAFAISSGVRTWPLTRPR